MKNILKLNKTIPIVLVFAAQVIFVLAIAMENISLGLIVATLILFTVVSQFKFLKEFLSKEDVVPDKIHFLYPLIGGICAVAPFLINNYTHVGVVISSAAVTLLSIIICKLLKNPQLQDIPALAFCASFIGMTTNPAVKSLLIILSAGFLGGTLFMFLKNALIGVGGKLGAIAFTSVVIINFILQYIK